MSISRTRGSPVGYPGCGAEPGCSSARSTATTIDYHNAPRCQLVVNLTGSVEIETGTGSTTGSGPRHHPAGRGPHRAGPHQAQLRRRARTCLFVPLDEVEQD